MSYVPNELNVTMNTNMPLFSKLKYKPDMTIKGLKSKNIQFNPLIKLNDSIVKNTYAKLKLINPKMLISELFLEKSNFTTLLNYHKSTGWIQNITLEQAHQDGNIDNNINITLKYVFEPRSLIYLKDEPYSIGALNWTTGDWKLDTKEKVQSLPTNNPYLRSAMITTRIISGDKELKALSKFHPNLMQGPNYVPDPSIFASGITPAVTPASAPIIPRPIIPASVPAPVIPASAPVIPASAPVIPVPLMPAPVIPAPLPSGPKLILPPPVPKPLPAITDDSGIEILPDDANYVPQPGFSYNEVARMRLPFVLYNKKNNKDVKATDVLQYVSDMGIDTISFKNIKRKSTLIDAILNEIKTPSTKIVQTYFNKGEFYKMLNSVYINFDDNIKTSINNVFMTQTPIQAGAGANLSKAAYESVIESLNVYPNVGGGDCFFIAIADAINNYNYVNLNTKITYNNNGVSRPFTVDILRTIVYDYLINQPPDIIDDYVRDGVENTQRLNAQFDEDLKQRESLGQVSADEYITLANEIFSNDALAIFVTKPTKVPDLVDKYYAPFSAVSKPQIEPYIKSRNYWADEIAVYAMANLLKINVIILEEKNNLLNSLCLIQDNTEEQFKDWDKYVFLYYSGGHYELVTFNFTRKPDKIYMAVPTITIFNRNPPRPNPKKPLQVYYIVPYYIIFCMFGSCYYPIKDVYKRQNIEFLKLYNENVFEIINKSLNRILSDNNYIHTTQSYSNVEFSETFNKYFPKSDIQKPINVPRVTMGALRRSMRNKVIGGADAYYQNPLQSIGKEESDICYTIKIDLMLRKGTTITDGELNTLLCNAQWNKITKPISTILNTAHSIPPDINLAIVNNRVAQSTNNKTKKIR
jgi:hypothetical protein